MHHDLAPTTALHYTVAALSAAALYLCWPLWPALVLAGWTAMLVRPLLVRFERGLKGRRRAAAVLVLLLFVALLVPLGGIALGVISGAKDLMQALSQTSSARSALEAIAGGGASGRSPTLPTSVAEFITLLQHYGAQGMKVLTDLAGVAASGLVGLLIYFGGAFAFLVDGPAAWSWFQRHSPLKPEHLTRFAVAFHETGRGLLIGVGLTTATQGLVATVAYAALGIPSWWVLGPITGLVSIVPLVGTSLIWLPLTLGLALTGHPVKATVLAVLGLAVISTIDNLLRPVFARMGSLKLPMFLLFVSIFGAIAAVGVWGAILGPLIVRLWMEALELRREAEESTDAGPARETLPRARAAAGRAVSAAPAPTAGAAVGEAARG